MAQLHVIPRAAPDEGRNRREADKLRALADQVERGEVLDYVAIAMSEDTFEAMTSGSKWTTVALARTLDAWAVGKLLP